ncbi:hypothetical protein ACQKDY_00535 [Alteromonas macleodii]|uniref:hypothetical protein n=1 Tax=Alteromonas macleodii TaxID=28108 RepID=UPI003D040BB7
MGKKEETLQFLEDALDRLVRGKPINTPNDGRISINRIREEARLGSGSVYYYKDFIAKAKKVIEENKTTLREGAQVSELSDIQRLRKERDKERELKKKYKDELDEANASVLKAMAENVRTEHELYELTKTYHELEKLFEQVTGQHPSDYDNNNTAIILPRDKQ